MKLYANYVRFVEIISTIFDKISRVILGAVVLLVIANIFMRVFLGSPIFGTYEFVGFFTSLVVGLALANCALLDGNISLEYFYDKIPQKYHSKVDVIINGASFIFFIFATWHLVKYGNSMILTGELSAATRTPIYIFIFVVAFGIFSFCLVLFSKTLESLRQVLKF